MALNNLKDIYVDQLQDLYSADSQAAKVTRELAAKAHDASLKEALEAGVEGIEEGMATLKELITAHGADPKGEFLSCLHADRVYTLLGTEGLGVKKMPEVGKPVGKTIGYHIRKGKHTVAPYDWERYLDFADRNHR